jgi:hypothetical protein
VHAGDAALGERTVDHQRYGRAHESPGLGRRGAGRADLGRADTAQTQGDGPGEASLVLDGEAPRDVAVPARGDPVLEEGAVLGGAVEARGPASSSRSRRRRTAPPSWARRRRGGRAW